MRASESLMFKQLYQFAFGPPKPKLTVVSDNAGWVLDEEARQIQRVMRSLNWRAHIRRYRGQRSDVFFFTDHFLAATLLPRMPAAARVSLAYFHGLPGAGVPEFDRAFESLQSAAPRVFRVQITHEEMRTVCLQAGFREDQIRKIYIAVDPNVFRPVSAASRAAARKRLGIAEDAVVVGSFQKDGSGWGEGDEPKLIKGPDVFVETIAALKPHIPRLHVLLSGPARGFVKKGLARLDVAFTHKFLKRAADVADLYHALDVYVVASRQEGGPKAVLESMASGIPIVSTRVGQARELIVHERNGFLVDPEAPQALADAALRALEPGAAYDARKQAGFQTAAANTYAAQTAQWADFFRFTSIDPA